jgi:hypothetical protein
MGSEAGRQPPRRDLAHELPDSLLAVQVNQIDGEAHPEGVYGFTRDDPQTFPGGETLTPQQSLIALWTAIGYFHASG